MNSFRCTKEAHPLPTPAARGAVGAPTTIICFFFYVLPPLRHAFDEGMPLITECLQAPNGRKKACRSTSIDHQLQPPRNILFSPLPADVALNVRTALNLPPWPPCHQQHRSPMSHVPALGLRVMRNALAGVHGQVLAG